MSDTAEIGGLDAALHTFLDGAKRRDDDGRQDADDGNDGQQFDEGKARLRASGGVGHEGEWSFHGKTKGNCLGKATAETKVFGEAGQTLRALPTLVQ